MSNCRDSILAALLLVSGGGLAFAQEDEPTEIKEVDITDAPPVAEEVCFMAREVRDFDAFDDRYVFVDGRRDAAYLLTLFAGCFGLRNANRIAISSDFSRVCSNSAATILYRDFGRMQACRIRSVESVDDKAAAEQIVERRKNGG